MKKRVMSACDGEGRPAIAGGRLNDGFRTSRDVPEVDLQNLVLVSSRSHDSMITRQMAFDWPMTVLY